ncbi:MAG: aspartate/glutamate racemase family protein [Chlamydiota bacterium]
MRNQTKNTIGIIGGAGPMAGQLLMKKIITNYQKNYGCVNDYDFPKMILLSYPFSEMLESTKASEKDNKISQQLEDSLDFLIENGANKIGIACNTLHGFLDKTCHRNRLVNLIKETKIYLTEQKFSKALVLCTNTSVQKNVHDYISISLPNNEEQKLIDYLIRAVLSGAFSLQESQQLKSYIFSKTMKDPVIDCVILGCTELSVLYDEFPMEISGIKMIDPLDLLASKICISK